MPDHNIRVKAVGNSPGTSPKPSNYCAWDCPYCHGKGLDPYSGTGSKRCPSCHGYMRWEADASREALVTCGRCAGTGRINYMGNWSVCTDCKGSGKV